MLTLQIFFPVTLLVLLWLSDKSQRVCPYPVNLRLKPLLAGIWEAIKLPASP